MAGVAGPFAEAELTRGPFSEMARAQYSALARMRWSMFRNTIRTTRGAMELGARIATTAIFSIAGLGIAAGLAAGAYAMVSSGGWRFLPILFWAVFVMWQVVPITIASFQQQFDMAGLLRFPVSFGTFFVLNLLFGLIDASTILGAFCSAGLWIGIVMARPDLFAWATAALSAFAVFNVLLVRTIFAWIDRWLAQRRSREIVMAIFFVLMLSLQLLNPALGVVKYQSPNSDAAKAVRQHREATLGPWLQRTNAAQRWLPPGLASSMVGGGGEHRQLEAVESLGMLGVFVIATGGTLAARLRAEYRGENLGEGPARAKVERGRRKWLLDGSGPMAAVFEKELRTLMRAIPLLYQVGSPIIVVFVLAGLNRNLSTGSSHLPLGLLLSLGYVIVGFTQLIYNNLGGEGPGIQMLFLSPTPIRTVILAKNLFHAALLGIDAVLVGVVACWRFGVPPPDAIAASAAWVLFALPVHLAAGNAFSLLMPYKINLSRIGKQKGSQANALLSLLVQVVTLGIGAGVYALCAWGNRLWLAVPVFLVMAAGGVFGWMRMLARVDAMANAHRDELITTLVKAE
jgi:ABC-2 type transport system permease protein